ncbi:complement factor I [Rhinophrynus dorsalis]
MKTLCLVCVLCLFCVNVLTSDISGTISDAEDQQKHTCQYDALSCRKVFCAPWQRCVDGKCLCKVPYQCPPNGTTGVCTEGKKTLPNYCRLKSAECANPIHRFSSEAPCTGKFEILMKKGESKGIVKVKVPKLEKESFLCSKGWGIREANVACKQLGFHSGADASFAKMNFDISEANSTEFDCLTATCRGLETSLAECVLRTGKRNGTLTAGVNCYTESRACNSEEFTCKNEKCIPLSKSCDGENDCGDLSDELCCKECKNSFHCKSDTCIPWQYKCNKEIDCISEEDESDCPENNKDSNTESEQSQIVNYDMEQERRLLKKSLAQISCGVPPHRAARQKRIIGGEKAKKNQFPWQVAIKDGSAVNCGGIYIGGCWVLTAAHCVRASQPQKYRIIIELLDRLSYDGDIDSFPVKTVKVHELYNPDTYENDIALLEVVNIYKKPECIQFDNNMVPACVPWSPYQFKAGDTCTVSGWGRAKGLSKVFHLMWGHINLMDNCTSVYKERFMDKMECAGTYDGSIDACKGDSGGPLVCHDVNNVAYVWGIVSWGENCGLAGFPGVYTKVALYFEWIARHVGRSLISKYNV